MTTLLVIERETENVAQAIEETITTPMPGFGHGKLGDIMAIVVWIAATIHIF